jgi:hypothetical protein
MRLPEEDPGVRLLVWMTAVAAAGAAGLAAPAAFAQAGDAPPAEETAPEAPEAPGGTRPILRPPAQSAPAVPLSGCGHSADPGTGV